MSKFYKGNHFIVLWDDLIADEEEQVRRIEALKFSEIPLFLKVLMGQDEEKFKRDNDISIMAHKQGLKFYKERKKESEGQHFVVYRVKTSGSNQTGIEYLVGEDIGTSIAIKYCQKIKKVKKK